VTVPRGHTAVVPSFRAVAALLAAALTLLAVIAVAANLDHRFRVIVLDTGGGSATLLRAPDGEVGLIGCGSQPDRLIGALGRVLPPTTRRVDLLVLPGSSVRLTAGCGGLPNHYSVGGVIIAGGVSNPERILVDTLGQAGATVATWGEGALTWAGVAMAAIESGGPESGTAALAVASGQVRTLLLGDLDPAAQDEIAATARVSLRSDLVVAPARGGVAISLLAAASPRLIAVPTVAGQAADHTVWPGAEVNRTGTDGDLGYVAGPTLARA
jgi:competence protein ComEC